jgi:cytochrome P450
MRAREAHGDVVKFRIGLWSAFLLSHPDDVRHVLQDNYQNYLKGFTFEYLKPLVGLGLLTAEGDYWLTQRRLVQPAFHHQRLDRATEDIVTAAEELCDSWHNRDASEPVDIVQEMTWFALRIIGKVLLGAEFSGLTDRISRAVADVQEHINWRLTHLYTTPDRFPTPRNLRFRQSLQVLEDTAFALIEGRREERAAALVSAAGEAGSAQAGSGGVLDLLLEAQERGPDAGVTDMMLRDEVMTMFIAGHETTANALAWTWHFLATNPEAEERLHSEADAVLSGRRLSAADLAKLQYARRVFEESLRLRPPAWILGRFPLADDTAGAYRIAAHSSVLLSPYVTHRHPEFWDVPEQFDPDRFLPENVASRPKHAYFPFGAGPRMCIGGELAMMEAVICLATIARRFRVQALPGHQVEMEPLITLRPKDGMPMTIRARA